MTSGHYYYLLVDRISSPADLWSLLFVGSHNSVYTKPGLITPSPDINYSTDIYQLIINTIIMSIN